MSDDNLTSVPSAPPAPYTEPLPESAATASPLELERRVYRQARGTGVLDWGAFVLAFLAPPLGLLAGIAALVVGHRTNGWGSGIAKAAVGIAVVLSMALGGGYALVANVQQKQAAHDAVIASSARWCSELRSTAAVLQSPTYDWPAEQGTVSQSIVAMQGYVMHWTELERVAPAGIRSGTASIAKAASGITSEVTSSRVLDDSDNQSTMTETVADSGVAAWASQYCK